MALTRVGGDLLKQPLNIGTGVTITTDGNATFSGIVTAANFVDAAGNPITGGGTAVGLGTVIIEGSTVGGEQIYYTDTTLTITGDLTVNPPDSSNIAYTQYSEIAVEQGYDLIVEDGDDLIPDILGLSTETAGVLPGAGGRVRADQFTNKAGTGAPSFPNGITIGADATVGSGLTVTGNLTVNGSKTYLNSDSVEFKDKNIGIASATTKLTDAQLNGAGFTIYGLNGDKSLTWDNPNDRMAFSTDLYAPNVTADGSITVGDTFLKPKFIGIGNTTTNVGINTAIGTLILNTSSNRIEVYGPEGWVNVKSLIQSGITATGGVISDYEDNGKKYRAHVFTSSGTFTVSDDTSDFGTNVEYLVVAGGGGGGSNRGGGGGGGGYRTSVTGDTSGGGSAAESAFPVSIGSYSVVVGSGGAGGSNQGRGATGTASVFDSGGPNPISSTGGGGGSGRVSTDAQPGGSGGGGGEGGTAPNAGAPGIPGQGYAGGPGGPTSSESGGGGGAGSAGSTPMIGGSGLRSSIVGPTYHIGADAATTGGWFSGGGGGSSDPAFGPGGGAPTAPTPWSGAGPGKLGGQGTGNHGALNTGGGAGGAGSSAPPYSAGGNGGSGIVVVRYQIGTTQTGTAKATGGNISFYNGKTIHTFTGTGSFTTPASFNETVEYVVIAGGGGGGGQTGGGGGAGGYLTGTTPISGPSTTTIQVGGGGENVDVISSPGLQGTPSYFGAPLTAIGGGYGGTNGSNGGPGGSGGGSGYSATGGTGTVGQGNDGGGDGSSWAAPAYGGSGGGGAGAVGQMGTTSKGGDGGIGVQLPATFRDPRSTLGAPGPGGGTFWVGGGGGAGTYNPAAVGAPTPIHGTIGEGGSYNGTSVIPGGPYAGGGGAPGSGPTGSGTANTGGGGAGETNNQRNYGKGGSGLVLVAYPT